MLPLDVPEALDEVCVAPDIFALDEPREELLAAPEPELAVDVGPATAAHSHVSKTFSRETV